MIISVSKSIPPIIDGMIIAADVSSEDSSFDRSLLLFSTFMKGATQNKQRK